jgi:hypothetical protein
MLCMCYSGRHVVCDTSLCLQCVEDLHVTILVIYGSLHYSQVGSRCHALHKTNMWFSVMIAGNLTLILKPPVKWPCLVEDAAGYALLGGSTMSASPN